MRVHPTALVRGLLKLAAVVLGAGLAGTLIGVRLAKVTEEGDEPPIAGPGLPDASV